MKNRTKIVRSGLITGTLALGSFLPSAPEISRFKWTLVVYGSSVAKFAYPFARRFPESAFTPAHGDAACFTISMVGHASSVSP